MITINELKEIIKSDEILTLDQFNSCIELFGFDAENDCELINDLYDFHGKIYPLMSREFDRGLNNAVRKYLYHIDTKKTDPQILYFLSVDYYFTINSLSDCLHYANKLIDMPNVHQSFKFAAISYALSILLKTKMTDNALQYVELLEAEIDEPNIDLGNKLICLLAIADVYAQKGDLDKYNEVLPKIDTVMSLTTDEKDLEDFSFYNNIHRMYHKIILRLEYTKEEILAGFKNAVECISKNPYYTDDYSMVVLPVLRAISDELSVDELINSVETIVSVVPNVIDKIDLYSFLIDEVKIDDVKYKDIYKEYFKCLHQHYLYTQDAKEHSITVELENYAAEKEYIAIKKKYHIDTMTGCYNRMFLQEIEFKPLGSNESVIYFDIDGLKTVNDTKGHYQGDEFINVFSNTLKSIFGTNGKCIRFGGDEFVVIYNDKDDKVLKNKLTLLKNKLHNAEEPFKITFSSGIYNGNIEDITVKEAINFADIAMYKCKRKNSCYVFYK